MKRLCSLIFFVLSGLVSLASVAAPAGQLDPTFGDGGIRTVGFNNPGGNMQDEATAMAKAADGRIYLVGAVNTWKTPLKYSVGMTRLTPDGVVDTTFGVNGRVTYKHPAIESIYVFDAAFQASGRLVVVGAGDELGGLTAEFIACGFNPDGTIDATFGDPQTPGCRLVPLGGQSGHANSLTIQPADGRIVMAGQTTINGTSRGVLVRLTANGALDTSFDFDGVSVPFDWLATDNTFNDVTLAPSGEIIAVGAYNAGNFNQDFFVARFEKEHGQRDMSFGDGSGYKAIKFDDGGSNWDAATAATVLADGSVLIAGFAETAGDNVEYRAAVAKLSDEGQPYWNWHGSGRRMYDPCTQMANGCDMRAFDIVELSNGQVVIAGALGAPGNPNSNDFFAMRLSATSDPDPSFGTQQPGQTGTAVVPVSNGGDSAVRMAVQGSRLVLAGSATPVPATATDFAIVRLDHGLNSLLTVSSSVVGNGSIDPDAPQIVPHSSHVNFTVTPAANHAIKSVTGCGGALVGNIYTTGPITQNCQVVATFAADVTLTYLADSNGSIQGPTPQVVPYNTNGKAVTAVPNEGYIFDRWSDFKQYNPRTDFNVTQDIAVTALFKPKTYKLVGTPVNVGGVAVPVGGKPVQHGNVDFITIQPDPGYGVAPISGCGGTLVGNAYVVGPMLESCYFDVTFEPSDAVYQLVYNADLHCKVNGDAEQSVASGYDGSEVIATADDGYVFLQWSDGNKNAARTDTHVFNHIKVTAQCAPIDAQIYTVTPKFGFGGALSPFVPQLVAENNSAQFSVLPAPGYGIGSVSGCEGSLDGNVYTTAPVTSNCEVQATFVPSNVMYSLDYAAGPGGTLEGSTNQVVVSGGSGTAVEAKPSPGRFFVQWSDGSTDNPRQDKNVIANVNVTAQFAADGMLTVTPMAGIGGTISPDLIQVVEPGAVVQFTVTPNPGFAIEGVEGCDGNLVGKIYTTGPVQSNCKVYAGFTPSDAVYLLKYTAGPNGFIEGGDVEQPVISGGSGPWVNAVPEPGYVFLQWSDGSTQNPRQDTGVIADIDVTAVFMPQGSLIVTPVVVGDVGGTLSPGDLQFVAPGGFVQFDVLPEPGFGIGGVAGTCGGSLNGNVYITDPVTENCTVEVTFVASDEQFLLTYIPGPGGGISGPTEQQVISGGTGAPVTAEPDPGYFFVKWSDGWVETQRQDANVVADIMVTAEFAPVGTPTYTVTPTWEAGGSLWPGEPFPVVEGDNAVLTVKPNPGFAIQSVEGCGGVLVDNKFATAPVTQDCEVHATFVPSNEAFTLTYTAGLNGLVNGQAQVQLNVLAGGEGIEVEAQPDPQPDPGFFFVQWSDGNIDNPRLDTNVAADIDVTATFAVNGTSVYEVSPKWSQGGALSPPATQHIAEGGSAKFTVVPAEGYAVVSVGGTCGGDLVGNVYTTDPVVMDCTVEAVFVPSDTEFTLTYLAGPGGSVNGQPMVQAQVLVGGSGPAVTAEPANGFEFLQWSDGSTDNPRTDTNVVGNVEVTAQFAEIGQTTWVVTPIPGPGGTTIPAQPFEVVEGEVTQITIVPNDGFAIESVGGTCGGNLEGNVFTTNPVTDHCTVEVSFFDDRIFYNGFGFGEEQE